MTWDVGLDLGATLTKLAAVKSDSSLEEFERLIVPSEDRAAVDQFLGSRPVRVLGATGGGAHSFAESLPSDACVLVDEFAAWGAGENVLLREAGFTPTEPHLLVSLGTGTSILKLDRGRATRVGGTALGGGTLRGLGTLLVGEADHDRLAKLAAAGDSRNVDLLVGDLYRPGDIALMPDLTAANFGRIRSREAADVASACARLVAENVALLAGALARTLAVPGEFHGRTDVVYAGATLRGHELLRKILGEVTALMGAQARFLPQGEFTGALGALARVRQNGR